MESNLRSLHGHTFRDCLPSCPVMIDLGANVGRFTAEFMAAYPGADVLLVEGDPLLVGTLAERFSEQPRVRLFRGLVGGRSTPKHPFHLCRIPEGNSVIRDFSESWSPGESRQIEVEMLTLADLLRLAAIERVDLLKLDIEGAEWDVLEGFSSELSLAVDQLTVEFHDFLDPSQRGRTEACIARLEELGYAADCRRTAHGHGSPYFDCCFYKP